MDLEVFSLVKLTGEVESWPSQFGQLLLRVELGTSSYSPFYLNVSMEASFPDIECSVLVTYLYNDSESGGYVHRRKSNVVTE
jgi:hypothetical protein